MTTRIAIIADWYLPRIGGLELYLRDLAKALQKSGLEVEVLTPVPGPGELDNVRIHRLCDMTIGDGGYTFAPKASASNFGDFLFNIDLFFKPRRLSALGRLRELLRTRRYDVAHVHLGNTPFSFAATNACIEIDLPTVATFHSTLGRGEVPIAWMLSKYMGCASWPGRVHLTAVSSNVAKLRSPLLANAKLEILPNAINVPEWQTLALSTGKPLEKVGQIELGTAMRLHKRKRPELLLTAMKLLKSNQQQGVSVRLRIAGDGPLRTKLQNMIDQSGLGECVQLCGNLDRKEIKEFVGELDLFLMPSILESFGIAALEARVAGVPVLTMEQSGARDFLKPNVDSMFASTDAEFMTQLSEYVSNPDFRFRLKEACKVPLQGYAWSDLVDRCHSIYANLLKQ